MERSESLPHSDEAERVLLGTILRHPECAGPVCALVSTPRAFYSTHHAAIWSAVQATVAAGGVADLGAVAIRLREADHADLIPLASSLEDAAGTPANAEWYARKVLNEWRKREALVAIQDASETCRNGATPADVRALLEVAQEVLTDPLGERALLTIGPADVLRREPEPIAWLVEGWLAQGDSCIFGGEWGTGKSVAALDLAIALATGGQWLGSVPCRRVPVVYVDEENNDRNVRRRMRQLLTGRNLSADEAEGVPLAYLSRNGVRLDEPDGLSLTHRVIERTAAKVLVIDSLVRFSRSDENSNAEMSRFFDRSIKPLMLRHDLAVVMLDHMRKPAANPKNDADPGHRIRGASDKPGFVDELWTLEGDRASRNRTLRHEKGRTDHLQTALTLTWTVSDDETAATLTSVEEQRGSETVILSALTEAGADGLLRADLQDALKRNGLNERAVTRALGKLHSQGAIRRAPGGNRTVRYWLCRVAQAGCQ